MDYPNSIPGVGLINGGFVDENPVAGTPGSLIPAAWGNSVTQEILNAIKAAGLTPDESKTNQLATAIGALVDFTKLKNTPTTLAGYGITDAVGRLLAVRQIDAVGVTVYKPNPRAKRIRVRLVGAGGSGGDAVGLRSSESVRRRLPFQRVEHRRQCRCSRLGRQWLVLGSRFCINRKRRRRQCLL